MAFDQIVTAWIYIQRGYIHAYPSSHPHPHPAKLLPFVVGCKLNYVCQTAFILFQKPLLGKKKKKISSVFVFRTVMWLVGKSVAKIISCRRGQALRAFGCIDFSVYFSPFYLLPGSVWFYSQFFRRPQFKLETRSLRDRFYNM